GIELPLRDLFETLTVAGLTDRIENTRRQAAKEHQAPPLRRVGREGDLPLSFAQQRLWFFDQLEPGNLFYSLPTSVRLTGLLNVPSLDRPLEEFLRRPEVLRPTFANREGQPVQVTAPPRPVRVPLTDLSDLPDGERENQARTLATEEAHQPL